MARMSCFHGTIISTSGAVFTHYHLSNDAAQITLVDELSYKLTNYYGVEPGDTVEWTLEAVNYDVVEPNGFITGGCNRHC